MWKLNSLSLVVLVLLISLGLDWGVYDALAQEPDGGTGSTVSAAQSPPPIIEVAGQIGGTVHNSWGAGGVTVVGNMVYVSAYDSLRLVDISNPMMPHEVGFCNVVGIGKVVVVGDMAYAAGVTWLHFIDVSDPTAPTELGFYIQDYLPYGANNIRDVAVVGNIAYLTNFLEGLRLVDISNFSAPIEVGWYKPHQRTFGVAVAGNMTYMAGSQSGLRLVDTSNPNNPVEVGSHQGLVGWSNDVAVEGHTVYLADGLFGWGGLSIIDASIPTHPRLLGSLRLGDADQVTVQGNYAYLLTEGDLHIVDVTHADNPVEVSFYDNDIPDRINDLAVQNNYVYAAGLDAGLFVLRLMRDKITDMITPGGGALLSSGGDTHLTFPGGAFTGTVTLTYRQLWQDQDVGERVGLGHTFELSAISSTTGQPAQLAPGQTFDLSVQYTDAEKGSAIEETIALYYWDGKQWVKEPSSVVDPAGHTVTARPDHWATLWAVLGETRRMFLPAILKK